MSRTGSTRILFSAARYWLWVSRILSAMWLLGVTEQRLKILKRRLLALLTGAVRVVCAQISELAWPEIFRTSSLNRALLEPRIFTVQISKVTMSAEPIYSSVGRLLFDLTPMVKLTLNFLFAAVVASSPTCVRPTLLAGPAAGFNPSPLGQEVRACDRHRRRCRRFASPRLRSFQKRRLHACFSHGPGMTEVFSAAVFDCAQRGEATTPKPRDRGSLAATRPSITRGKVSLRERRLGPAPGPAPSAQARAGARSPADIRRLSESAIRARHPSQKLRPRQGGGGVAHWWKGAGRRRRMCRAFGDRSRRCGGGGGGRRRRRRRRRKII